MSERRTTVGHCKKDSTDTYIGRGRNQKNLSNSDVGERGWLGNPFITEEAGGDYTREESVRKFEQAFYERLAEDVGFRTAVEQLTGDTLGCWCRSEDEDDPACHGDVIARYLNSERLSQ